MVSYDSSVDRSGEEFGVYAWRPKSPPRRCRVAMLRGRKAVRADRRSRTDEKHIRTQSTILYNPNPFLLVCITVFSVRMRFSSVQKTRLARAARNGCPSTTRRYTRADRAAAARLARTAIRPRGSPIAHGREACPHAIGDLLENQHAVFVVIRTENTVGARERASPLVACDSICGAPYGMAVK